MIETSYKCPVCQGPMSAEAGDFLHPGDPKFGMYVFCPSLTCPAQEVAGHGRNEKDAFEVVTDKFKGHL